MNRRTLGALVSLNAALLIGLTAVTLTPRPAEAQLSTPEFILIAGRVEGRDDQSAIYVLEKRAQRMIALFFNGNTNRFEVIGGRELSGDFAGG
jgi:hypothetical protein